MELLSILFVNPFLDMADSPVFLMEVIVNGLLTGVLYSLVALGFVLIFKASGVFNFAQGAMVLFAALTLVGLIEHGVPVIIAIFLTVAVMVALAVLIERLMLRHLVNQEGIILFMATIGLNFILEGAGQIAWGSDVKKLSVGLPDGTVEWAGMLLSTLDLTGADWCSSGHIFSVLFSLHDNRARIACSCRRPSSRLVSWYSIENNLDYCMGGCRLRCVGCWYHVGC